MFYAFQKTESTAPSTDNKSANKKIHAYDYRAWDRFDVDSALAEVDKEQSKEEEEETDEEWEEERRTLLAKEEKEKGTS